MTIDEHIENSQETLAKVENMYTNSEESIALPPSSEGSIVFKQLPLYEAEIRKTDLNKESRRELENRVKDLWRCLTNKGDLLDLLNVLLAGIYGEQSETLTIAKLNSSIYTTIDSRRYTTFQIPKKKKGEFRTIDAPVPMLKHIQRGLNFALQCIYTPHEAAMGFVPHRSVVTGAKVHTGQRLVYNIDLKDFFPSITAGRVYRRLMAKPFNLPPKVASIITDLCCYTNAEGKHVLPQGAPTSPTITNIICERMDHKLARLAKAYGLKYTRYADDITFSGMVNLFYEGSRFLQLMHRIVEEEHFTINGDKTRLCHQGMRQEVTGLTVNRRENVSRCYIKQLRTLIHNWEMNGYEKAQEVFAKHYAETSTKHLRSKGTHHIENIIAGKLMYLKMVKGETDSTYRSLYERFDALLKAKKEQKEKERETLQKIFIEAMSAEDTNEPNGEPDEMMTTFEELEELLKENI